MARETWEAYGFVGNAGDDPAALVGSVASVRGIRFTARTVGAYDALLAVETPTLSMLQDEIATAVARAGARDVRWSIVVDSLRFHPKRRDTDVAAFVRFPADDPVATAEALHDEFASLNDRDGYGFGAAVVTGAGYDVLVDLGAPTPDELVELVFRLRGVNGVGPTETTVCMLQGNAHLEGS